MRHLRSLVSLMTLVSCVDRETPFVIDDDQAQAAATDVTKTLDSGAFRIGALFAFESKSSLTENNTLSGIELAVREANARGGVAGHQLEIVKLPFDGTGPSAELAARTAAASKLTAVIGPSWSNPALKAAPILDEAHLPMIVTLASHPDVTARRRFVFRAIADDNAQARALATFATGDLHAGSYASFIDLGDASSLSSAALFVVAMEALGAHETARIEYTAEGADTAVTAAWTKLLAKDPPPVVFLPTKVRDTARIVKLGRDAGYQGTFIGGDGWGNRELIVSAGSSIRGAYFVTHWQTDVNLPASIGFLERYLGTHRTEPTVGAAIGYDAAQILITALQRTNGGGPDDLQKALETGAFETTTGTLRFGADHSARRSLLILKVGISRFELVKVLPVDEGTP